MVDFPTVLQTYRKYCPTYSNCVTRRPYYGKRCEYLIQASVIFIFFFVDKFEHDFRFSVVSVFHGSVPLLGWYLLSPLLYFYPVDLKLLRCYIDKIAFPFNYTMVNKTEWWLRPQSVPYVWRLIIDALCLNNHGPTYSFHLLWLHIAIELSPLFFIPLIRYVILH